MPKPPIDMMAVFLLIAPVLLGASHTEGEDYLPFLFAVFAVTWAAFFAYAFFISRKQVGLKREIDSLSQDLQDRGES